MLTPHERWAVQIHALHLKAQQESRYDSRSPMHLSLRLNAKFKGLFELCRICTGFQIILVSKLPSPGRCHSKHVSHACGNVSIQGRKTHALTCMSLQLLTKAQGKSDIMHGSGQGLTAGRHTEGSGQIGYPTIGKPGNSTCSSITCSLEPFAD